MRKAEGQLSAWFRTQGVRSGEWYGEAKAFTRAAVRAGLSPDAAIVLFALRPYTVGYRSQKAIRQVKDENGQKKTVSVTPNDLALDTGFTRQKVRDALAELEEKGFGSRKAADGGDLRKGNVEIYCWTLPRRPQKKEPEPPRPGYKVSPAITFAAHLTGLRIPKGFVPSERYKAFVEDAFRRYKELSKVPLDGLKEALIVAPDAPAYKEERKTFKDKAERAHAPSHLSVSQSPPSMEEDRPTDTSNQQPINTPENIQALLLETLGRKLPGEVPSANLCKRIAAKLRNAPPDLLKERIKNRRKAITSMGMVENLADDVGKRWVADQAIRESGREPSRADEVAYLRQHWHEYPEDERSAYLKAFPELGAELEVGG